MILPASWYYDSDLLKPELKWVSLHFNQSVWVYGGRFPSGYTESVWGVLNENFDRWVIRGIRPELLRYFRSRGKVYSVYAGEEFLIDLQRAEWKSSLITLKRRAERKGEIVSLSFPHYRDSLCQFFTKLREERGELLRYLFSYELTSSIIGLIYFYRGQICGLVTASQAGVHFWQVELMMRLKSAPVGVMEGLILTLAEVLRDKGAKYLSLGECPFVGQPDRGIDSLYFVFGRQCRFLYNYKGLYFFKRKFTSLHQSLYWVANYPLTLFHFAELFHKSGFSSLLHKKISPGILNSLKLMRKKRGAFQCPSQVV